MTPIELPYQRGFTLIEMIVVLVILAMTAGLMLARGPMHSTRLDTEAAARDLVGTLRLARSRAIAANRQVTVTVGQGAWQVEGMPQRSAARDVTLAGTTTIMFAPDGSSSGGQIAVQGYNRQIGIVIDWLTGRVRLTGAG